MFPCGRAGVAEYPNDLSGLPASLTFSSPQYVIDLIIEIIPTTDGSIRVALIATLGMALPSGIPPIRNSWKFSDIFPRSGFEMISKPKIL